MVIRSKINSLIKETASTFEIGAVFMRYFIDLLLYKSFGAPTDGH